MDNNPTWYTPGYLKLVSAWAYLICQRNLGNISDRHWEQCVQLLIACGRSIRSEIKAQ